MNNEIKLEILNLAQSVFDDRQFNIILTCLDMQNYNRLRLFVAEQMELLEAIFVLHSDDMVLRTQVELCNKLEDLVMDVYIGELN